MFTFEQQPIIFISNLNFSLKQFPSIKESLSSQSFKLVKNIIKVHPLIFGKV